MLHRTPTYRGGDAQTGALTVMFDRQWVNSSYDPMRKEGAILLAVAAVVIISFIGQ